MKNKNIKKYAFGSEGLGSMLGGIINQLIEGTDDPNSEPSVSQNEIVRYNPYGGSYAMGGIIDPMRQLLTNSIYANGGQVPGEVPVEVEGGENAETPDGQFMEFEGPSHESGGIQMTLPPGTKIFSKRIEVGGKTMEERKKARVNSERKIKRNIESNPGDRISKLGLARLLSNNEAQEKADLNTQNTVAISREIKKKFAAGGIVDDNYGYNRSLQDYNYFLGENDMGTLEPAGWNPDIQAPNTQPLNVPNLNLKSSSVPQESGMNMNTIGNMVGLAGQLYGAISPLIDAKKNAANSKPYQNFFRNFGKDALATNESEVNYAENAKANAMTDLRTQSNASRAGSRNSSNSIQTLRSLDTINNMAQNQGANQINNSFASQMMSILGQRSQLQNQRDQVVMTGNQQTDLANRQEQDAISSNIANAHSQLATGVQGIGRSLNQIKSNDDIITILNSSGQYVKYRRGANGKLQLVGKNS